MEKKNKHNFTEICNLCDMSRISVGNGTYGKIKVLTYGGENSNLKIGSFCSIADETVFLLGGEHAYNKLSTFPFKAKYLNKSESITKGHIVINDDVWIGYGSTILSGVKIGKGSIIGAKSVVSKDVPPYAIYCGNRIVKYRFSENIINKLKTIDISKLDKSLIREKIEFLYQDITDENVDSVLIKIFGENNEK